MRKTGRPGHIRYRMGSHTLCIAKSDTEGQRDIIFGASGSGKSYTLGVLMEEHLINGQVLCVIDASGEHWTLKERYPVLVCGGSHSTPIPSVSKLTSYVDTLTYYVSIMLSKRISVVFDISQLWDTERTEAYVALTTALFRAQQTNPDRQRIRLVVDEAQNFAPQGKETKSLAVSVMLAKEGRKYGIDQLWATQRPASVSKDVVSQCNGFWFGKVTAATDLKALQNYLADAQVQEADIKGLKKGQFYYYSGGSTHLIKVRKRYCRHGGETPGYE